MVLMALAVENIQFLKTLRLFISKFDLRWSKICEFNHYSSWSLKTFISMASAEDVFSAAERCSVHHVPATALCMRNNDITKSGI